MNIRLRIVGLYFNKLVTVPDTEDGVTIKDVIETYIQQSGGAYKPGGLDYYFEQIGTLSPKYDGTAAPPPGESLLGFIYNNPAPETLSGIKREGGIYSLFENYQDAIKVGLGWQSYVLEPSGKNRTATEINGKFRFFNQTKVNDGETIVWRLVAICRAPNFPVVTVVA